MDQLFKKTGFPKSPGGDCYEWGKAEVVFSVHKNGSYVIVITASAKDEKQNNSNDDDDLRIALDGFSFGKYEKKSWKGFGSTASWNGASLKGGAKTIYFFVELGEGSHRVQFFADETPEIKSLEVFAIEDNKFILTNLEPSEKIESTKEGIPWIGFVFVGTHAKSMLLDVSTKSGKEKGGTDGDNLKVVINGDILQNEKAQSSKKYKNFYFSGDVKQPGILLISDKDLSKYLVFENSIELWHDQKPKINSLEINFFDTEKFLKELKEIDLRKYVLKMANAAVFLFQIKNSPYSAKFLKHSLEEHPSSLVFKPNHPIVSKVKADPVYKKILKKLKEKITNGMTAGEILPTDIEGGISFDSADLNTAIHGIRKIEYKASFMEKGDVEVTMTLFDVYDFKKQDVPLFIFSPYEYAKSIIINTMDIGEDLHVIHNFEIQINIKDKLSKI